MALGDDELSYCSLARILFHLLPCFLGQLSMCRAGHHGRQLRQGETTGHQVGICHSEPKQIFAQVQERAEEARNVMRLELVYEAHFCHLLLPISRRQISEQAEVANVIPKRHQQEKAGRMVS